MWAASLDRAGRLCAYEAAATCSGRMARSAGPCGRCTRTAPGRSGPAPNPVLETEAGASPALWNTTELIGLNRTEDGRLLMALHGAGLMQLAGDKVEAYPIRDASTEQAARRSRCQCEQTAEGPRWRPLDRNGRSGPYPSPERPRRSVQEIGRPVGRRDLESLRRSRRQCLGGQHRRTRPVSRVAGHDHFQ